MSTESLSKNAGVLELIDSLRGAATTECPQSEHLAQLLQFAINAADSDPQELRDLVEPYGAGAQPKLVELARQLHQLRQELSKVQEKFAAVDEAVETAQAMLLEVMPSGDGEEPN